MSDYGDFRKGISPPWLQDRFGAGWADALGQLQDQLADATKAGVKARFPLLAPPDALEQLGIERQMPRGVGETDTSYARRLRAAWDSWQYAGTAFGLLSALAAAGYVAEVRIQNAVRYSLDAEGKLVVEQRAAGEWWIDFQRSFWSRFVVLLLPPYPSGGVTGPRSGGSAFPPTVTGYTSNPTILEFSDIRIEITTAGTVDGGATFWYTLDGGGSYSANIPCSATPTELGDTGIYASFPAGHSYANGAWDFDYTPVPDDSARVAALIAKWKPAHATCTDVFLIPSGRTWDSYPAGATWDAQSRATWDSDLATVTRWSP